MKENLEVKFPFLVNNEIIYRFLLENGFANKFTLSHKIYYNIIRKLLPYELRRYFQNKALKNINYVPNFIYDELLKYIEPFILNKFVYKNNAHTAVVLTHDVEEKEGFNFIPKVIELEEKYGFKSSWNIVPYKYKVDYGIINLIKENGHEIGIHGYNHDGKLYYSEKIFNERSKYINEALKKFDAVGFRSPMVHRNLKWLQKLNIEYDASCFDYDPFQPFPGGTGSIWPFIAGKFVELPYTLPQDHTLLYVLKRKDISIWINKAKWVAENKGTILVLTHPDYLKENNYLELYEELLKYLKSFKSAWYCLPKELARWWKNVEIV